jgi:hypothetical protein
MGQVFSINMILKDLTADFSSKPSRRAALSNTCCNSTLTLGTEPN